MLVVFGLGNPGSKYEGTRHNAGVETLERLAASYHARLVRRCLSSYRTCVVESARGERVRLVFPLTYMNDSGRVVPRLVSGGDRVHNGLKSMMQALPDGFERLYIGVGRPGDGVSVVDHVLSRPDEEDRRLIDAAEAEAAEGLRLLIEGEDFQKVVQRLNSFRGR